MADAEDKLQKLVEFGRVCERRKLKVNVNKSRSCSAQSKWMGRDGMPV